MDGLECLKETLMKDYGLSRQQADSKGVTATLDVLSKSGGIYTDIEEARARLDKLKRDEAALQQIVSRLEARKSALADEITELEAGRAHYLDKDIAYIEAWNKSLGAMETPEKNAVDTETPQNNTAFIYGLAMILSGAPGTSFPDGFRKITADGEA